MNDTRLGIGTSQEVECLLMRLSQCVETNLSESVAFQSTQLPKLPRDAIVEVNVRLREVVASLFELETAYEDSISFLRFTQEICEENHEVDAYRRLRFLYCHLTHLVEAFSALTAQVEEKYNAVLETLAADEHLIDIERIVASARGGAPSETDGQWSDLVDWFSVMPSPGSQRRFCTPRIASRHPQEWPESGAFFAQAHGTLVRKIESQCREMKMVSMTVVLSHGPAIQELMERQNTMMANFRLR